MLKNQIIQNNQRNVVNSNKNNEFQQSPKTDNFGFLNTSNTPIK